MKKVIMLLCFAAFAAQAETVVIEAEWFEDYGGWVNDTQFMDQMGSPYLLAHGLGRPVADAKMSFSVEDGVVGPAYAREEEEPEPGAEQPDKKSGDAKAKRFKVMVRTMNWTARWSKEPAGTFKVVVDGKELPNVLGAGKGEWSVEEAGVVELGEGTHTMALRDLTGFDGRCDAVAFVDEADENPVFERTNPGANFGGWMNFDLCVVGGGIAGICTAVSAARLGLSVALVHDRPVLGGNNSSEVRVHLGAYQNIPPYPRLGDVLAEFGPKSGGNAREASVYEDEKKLAIVKAEKNIRLFLNTHMRGVATNETGAIMKLYAQNTVNSGYEIITAKWFADCTGDGNLGFAAGADFRMGREAKSETNEPDAPATADTITMGASVQWNAGKASGDASFPTRPWMLKTINEVNCSPHLKGDWWWEAGLGRDQIAEGEYISRRVLELGVRQERLFQEGGVCGQGAQVGRVQRWSPRVAQTTRRLHSRPEPSQEQGLPARRHMRDDVDNRPASPEDGARVEVRGRALSVQLAQRKDLAVSDSLSLSLFAERPEPLHGRARHLGDAHCARHDSAYAHARHDGRGRRHGGEHLQEAPTRRTWMS